MTKNRINGYYPPNAFYKPMSENRINGYYPPNAFYKSMTKNRINTKHPLFLYHKYNLSFYNINNILNILLHL